MKFNNLITEASQEIVQQFNSFYDEINKTKEITNFGDLRMREIYLSQGGYNMLFHLKSEYAMLSNTDSKIRYILKLLKDIAIKYNKQARVKRENAMNNQAVIKIIFKDSEEKE